MNNLMKFEKALRNLINVHGLDNENNTPDYILAEHMIASLISFSRAQSLNMNHQGVELNPPAQIE